MCLELFCLDHISEEEESEEDKRKENHYRTHFSGTAVIMLALMFSTTNLLADKADKPLPGLSS